jgi:hypothetical protein
MIEAFDAELETRHIEGMWKLYYLPPESGTSTIAGAVPVEMVRDPAGPGARGISIVRQTRLHSVSDK